MSTRSKSNTSSRPGNPRNLSINTSTTGSKSDQPGSTPRSVTPAPISTYGPFLLFPADSVVEPNPSRKINNVEYNFAEIEEDMRRQDRERKGQESKKLRDTPLPRRTTTNEHEENDGPDIGSPVPSIQNGPRSRPRLGHAPKVMSIEGIIDCYSPTTTGHSGGDPHSRRGGRSGLSEVMSSTSKTAESKSSPSHSSGRSRSKTEGSPYPYNSHKPPPPGSPPNGPLPKLPRGLPLSLVTPSSNAVGPSFAERSRSDSRMRDIGHPHRSDWSSTGKTATTGMRRRE